MNSGNLDDRDLAVLRHIVRYRLTFKEVLSYLYFNGSDPQARLNNLAKQELITACKGFGGNRSAYAPLPAGVAMVNGERGRDKAVRREVRSVHFAIFSFCFLCGKPRARVEISELQDELGLRLPRRHNYVLEHSTKAKRLYHLYVPGDGVPSRGIVEATRLHINQHREIPELEPWLTHKLLYFGVLVNTNQRRDALHGAFGSVTESGVPLRKLVGINVSSVPGVSDLGEALHALA